jgi:hypothetical protein
MPAPAQRSWRASCRFLRQAVGNQAIEENPFARAWMIGSPSAMKARRSAIDI